MCVYICPRSLFQDTSFNLNMDSTEAPGRSFSQVSQEPNSLLFI